jgi:hypothetical protein
MNQPKDADRDSCASHCSNAVEMMDVDETWEKIAKFMCRTCGDLARRHPQTEWIWGCLRCGGFTRDVAINFMPTDEFDYPVAARSIALHLEKFCDKDAPYPVMIANAVRDANDELEWAEAARENMASLLDAHKNLDREALGRALNGMLVLLGR